jgi:hypothetical protein
MHDEVNRTIEFGGRVLVLLMGVIYYVYRCDRLISHDMYIKIHDDWLGHPSTGACSNIKIIMSIWEPAVLVLLLGIIYDVRVC